MTLQKQTKDPNLLVFQLHYTEEDVDEAEDDFKGLPDFKQKDSLPPPAQEEVNKNHKLKTQDSQFADMIKSLNSRDDHLMPTFDQ